MRRSTDSSRPRGLHPGDRVGPYRIEGEVGRGGMGAVFRVTHVETGVGYALKVVLPRVSEVEVVALERFRREAEILARLDAHPNIVRVFSFGREGDILYSILELIEGRSAGATYKDRAAPPEEAARIVAGAARAAHHAHRHGILHRDIKPDNIVVDAAGTPRMLDFGLALDARESRLTLSNEVVGTPTFMAPEQVDPVVAGASVGPQCDVYGLGATLYTLLTGASPFPGDDSMSVLRAVLEDHPRPPTKLAAAVPPELEAICLHAMAKYPAARYRTAAELADDLERWGRGDAITARRLGVISQRVRAIVPARGRRRRSVLVGAAVVALVAATLAGVSVFTLLQRRDAAADTARAAAQARARAAIAEQLEQAARPDAVALERALELTRQLDDELAGRDASLAEARRFLEGVVAVARTPVPARVPTRGTTLDALARSEAWASHGRILVATLIHDGDARSLGRLLDTRPELVEDEDLLLDLAARLDAGQSVDARILWTVDDALAARTVDGGAAAELDARRRRVLTGHLARVLVDEPVDWEAVDGVLARLLPLLRRTELAPPIDLARVNQLLDHSRRDAVTRELTPRSLARLLEAGLLLLPEEAELTRQQLLLQLVQAAMIEGEAGDDAGFELALIAHRHGVLIAGLDQLVHLSDDDASLRAELDAMITARDGGFDPERFLARLIVILRRAESLAPGWRTDRGHPWQDVLREQLPRFDALLRREAHRADLPAWVLSDIAAFIDDAYAEAIDDGWLGRWALELRLEAAGDDYDRALAIGGLHERAWRRARELPLWRRPIEPFERYARWLTRQERLDAPELTDALLEALEVSVAGPRYLLGQSDVRVWHAAGLAREVCFARVRADVRDDAGCSSHDLIDRTLAVARHLRYLNGDPAVWELEAQHALAHGGLEEAIEALRRGDQAVRGHDRPDEKRGYLALARAAIYIEKGEVELARAELLDAGDLPLRDSSEYRTRSFVWNALGEPGRAEADRLRADQ